MAYARVRDHVGVNDIGARRSGASKKRKATGSE
jgi:hypothetical protein